MVTDSTPASRTVAARVVLDVQVTADLVFAIAVAEGAARERESLSVELDGTPVDVQEIATGHGGRLHQLRGAQPGRLSVTYDATVTGSAPPAPVGDEEWYHYIRPSRYCESDQLGPLARDEFAGLAGFDLLDGISSWVGQHIAYVPGSSRATDGATATLLGRSGVCRDFAHLTVALLRGNGIPARVVAVYAPGLDPMDFHAVVEACVDDAWYVVDPTSLAPRPSLLRIATGADAADTAWLTTVSGVADLVELEVAALADPDLPVDRPADRVQLR